MNTEEKILLKRCKEGDVEEAFSRLFSIYEREVYNLAFRLSNNHHDAEDIALEAFIKVYKSIGRFRGESKFSTWLYRIVTNTFLNELKKKRRHPTESLDDPLIVASASKTPQEEVESRELKEEVQRAIASLPEECRVVLVLYDIQGLSYSEIQKILKLKGGTLKSRLHRARMLLKERLAGIRRTFLD